MTDILQYVVFALSFGAIYAVAASGLVVTYTTSGIFNFAHGAIGMFAAFTYWELRVERGMPAPIALALVLLVLAPLFGLLVERLLMRNLAGASTITKIVVTIGLLVALLSAATIIWPTDERRNLPRFFEGNEVEISGVVVAWHFIIVFLIAIAVAIGLRLLLYRTRIGISMRAVVDNRELTRLNGANPERASMASWALGSTLAALAGILIGSVLTGGQLGIVNLTLLVISAYAAAMVGRLQSLPLTFLGGLILASLENSAAYINANLIQTGLIHDFLEDIRPAIPVIMLFVVLLVLPRDRAALAAAQVRTHIPRPTMRQAVIAGAVLVGVAYVATYALPADWLVETGKGIGLAIVMLSLVPLVGYAGQISLAQLGFAGLGAIAMLKWGDGGNPLGLLLAVGLAAGIGALIALPALKLRDLYLALATLAFALFLEGVIFANASSVFGAELEGFAAGGQRVARLQFFESERANFVLLALAFSLLGILVVWLRRGPFGRRLQAMKDSPAACATLGLDLTVTKLQVFALAAGMAGLGGALFAGWKGNLGVGAADFSLLEGALPGLPVVLLAVVGGITAVAGALLGGVLLALMPLVGNKVPSLADLMNLLPGLVGIALARNPDGIVGQVSRQFKVLMARRRGEEAEDERPVAEPAVVPERVGVGGRATPQEVRALDDEIGLSWGSCSRVGDGDRGDGGTGDGRTGDGVAAPTGEEVSAR